MAHSNQLIGLQKEPESVIPAELLTPKQTFINLLELKKAKTNTLMPQKDDSLRTENVQ